MLDRGGTDPANYTWRATPKRVMAFTSRGELFLDVRMPKSVREALLLGYLQGWDHGDDVHRAYVHALEELLGDSLPRRWDAAPCKSFPGFRFSSQEEVLPDA